MINHPVTSGLTNWSGGAGTVRGRILGGGRQLLKVRDQAGCEIRQGRSGASGAAQFPGEGAGRPRHLHGVVAWVRFGASLWPIRRVATWVNGVGGPIMRV